MARGADPAPPRPIIEKRRMTIAVRQREFWAAILVLALSIGYLLWAKTYPPAAGAVPVLVAWATIVLSIIDAVSQFETPLGRWVRRLVTAERIVEWKMEGDEDAPLTRILLAVAWISGYLAALFLIGFIIATPVYILSYMLIHGGRSLRDSALAAAAITLTIWLVFVVLFNYPLYPGVLFGGY
jgi:Tripartite tricarboxylate transporter TctB family